MRLKDKSSKNNIDNVLIHKIKRYCDIRNIKKWGES